VVAVMIGIDPHKASHTAVAIDAAEQPLGQLRVRACAAQVERLLAWAQAWPERAWAVEGAGGVGHLLAQQLLSAGERVLDVQPKLAARVRLLATGDINKNDPNDARSVAVAALRSPGVREARRDDHAAVLKVWPGRHKDLGRTRTQVACRLHAVLCELVPGGVSMAITAGQAAHLLASITPAGSVAVARCELAAEFTEDLRRIDVQLRGTKNKLAAVVRAAGTGLTGLYGAGPVIAAAVIGDVRHASRFPSRNHFAAYNGTAPIEVSSGGRKIYRLSRRGNRRLNHAIHMAAVTQIRNPGSEGRAYYEKKLAEGKTRKEALRALKRQVSDAIFACLQADARRAAAVIGSAGAAARGGQAGGDLAAVPAVVHDLPRRPGPRRRRHLRAVQQLLPGRPEDACGDHPGRQPRQLVTATVCAAFSPAMADRACSAATPAGPAISRIAARNGASCTAPYTSPLTMSVNQCLLRYCRL
jgi:transposase